MRDWLKDARKAKGMTLKDVADRIGVSESYYLQIERGDRAKKMDIPLATALSTALDVPLYQIIVSESTPAGT